MTITYTDDLTGLTPDQLTGFFEGWPSHPDPATHLAVLEGSTHVWLAVDDGRVVGFVNALTDGVFYAYLPLLEVLPDWQGQGIGRELVRRIVATLDRMYAVDVACDPSVAQFYAALGFQQVVGMVRRNHDRQAGAPR